MKALAPGFAAHIAQGVTTLAWCWLLRRQDGVVQGFTDHDQSLTFDGVTYEAASGFSATAIEDQLGLATANLDVVGALRSDSLTEADLNNGRYDDAEVTILRVNWANPADREIIRFGWIGQVSRGRVAFKAEMRGLASKLDQAVGRLFQRTCAWNFGDVRCGKTPTTGAGAVGALVTPLQFTATELDGFDTGLFAYGRLTWTSGANAGVVAEVWGHTLVDGVATLTLMLPMGEAITGGDAFSIAEGCDNTWTACQNKANVINFGGFPHMPGNDYAVTYASSGDNNNGAAITPSGSPAVTAP